MCNMVERTAFSLANSLSLRRFRETIFLLRDELFRMIFHDWTDADDHYTSDGPRALSFFLKKKPYFTELRMENDKVQYVRYEHHTRTDTSRLFLTERNGFS